MTTAIEILVIAWTPPLLLLFTGASWIVMILGAGAWLIGVGVKVGALKLGLESVVLSVPEQGAAAVYGILSALAELGTGAAALLLHPGELQMLDVIAFGAGASSIEASLLGAWALIGLRRQTKATTAPSAGKPSFWIHHLGSIERCSALILHIATRGLVYVALVSRDIIPCLVAIIAFATVDGTAAYGKLAGWTWFAPSTAKRYFSFVFGIDALAAFAFLLGWLANITSYRR